MDKVAIVILNWNGKKMLQTYLPSVIAYSEGAHVYVADNASTDNSLDFLRKKFPKVSLIPLEKNWGFANGYNKALEQIAAKYYVLLNSDVEVTEKWLKPLVDYMDTHDEVAACQPKLLSAIQKDSFEYAGAAGGFLDRYGYPFCRGRIFNSIEKDNAQYNEPIDVLWATGACLLIRRDDYWMANGLDGRFFAHNEEIDLCWRLRLRGRKIVCLPNAKVYHLGGGTLPKGNPMKTYLNFRNNLTMLYKNLPENELKTVMRVRWFLDHLAAWQALILNRSIGDFKAVYRARKDFRRWKKEFSADRTFLQTLTPPQIPERKRYSILWQYYIKGRRCYSLLPK